MKAEGLRSCEGFLSHVLSRVQIKILAPPRVARLVGIMKLSTVVLPYVLVRLMGFCQQCLANFEATLLLSAHFTVL